MKILGVIPARYASTRFPGKPLVDIGGKSMIQRVFERSTSCKMLDAVVVATDDERIFNHVEGFGGKCLMTSSHHRSGTDRIGEVLQILEAEGARYDVIVNIQGDEPFLDPREIELLISCFTGPSTEIATLVKPIIRHDDIFNPNVVKVITGMDGRALYFSRSAIPFVRGSEPDNWLQLHTFYSHVGIYAYRDYVLQALVKLPPAPAETAESLEQLRWLEHGYSVYTKVTKGESIAIDTPDDLLKLTNII